MTNLSSGMPMDNKSEPCPVCKKPLHWKRMRQLAGYKDSHVIGRPRKANYELIRRLKKQGKSLRAIAHETTTSIGSVRRALRAPK